MALGAISVPVLYALADRAFPVAPRVVTQAVGTVFMALMFAAYLGYRVEQDDIAALRIPKAEYARVAAMVESARAGRLDTLFRVDAPPLEAVPPPGEPPLPPAPPSYAPPVAQLAASDALFARYIQQRAPVRVGGGGDDDNLLARGYATSSSSGSGSGGSSGKGGGLLRSAHAVDLPPPRGATTLSVPPPTIPT